MGTVSCYNSDAVVAFISKVDVPSRDIYFNTHWFAKPPFHNMGEVIVKGRFKDVPRRSGPVESFFNWIVRYPHGSGSHGNWQYHWMDWVMWVKWNKVAQFATSLTRQ